MVGADEYCPACFAANRFRRRATDSFAEILSSADNPMAVAMLLVLAWVAYADGELAPEELVELRSIAEDTEAHVRLSSVIEIARKGEILDLQLACEVLQQLEPKHRRLMLQMAIGIALKDGYLMTTEGHIVRFIADVLSQTPSNLDEVFKEMTGTCFPPAADPSSIEWWETREQGKRSRHSSTSGEHRSHSESPPSSPSLDLQRLRDLAVLGLDENATIDDVRVAYRRMAQIHHPDRFAMLGLEAVRAAEVSFRRIQAAYERLVAE